MSLISLITGGDEKKMTARPHHLTIFTFFWACQALVHQEFFFVNWLPKNDPMGWVLTGFLIATLLFPRSITLFSFMLISSLVYNIGIWPEVVNHILLESIIDVTILFAIAYSLLEKRASTLSDSEFRSLIFARMAPVILMFVILMYWFIVNSKSNADFFDMQLSCIADFYIDVTDRFGFLGLLPELDVTLSAMPAKISLWIFMVVEVVIPVCLMFKKTRYIALIIGIPFHLLLAAVGHRTFSGFILALYALILADSLSALLADIKNRINEKLIKFMLLAARIIVITLAIGFSLFYFFDIHTFDELFRYRVRQLFFLSYWGLVGSVFLLAILRHYIHGDSEPTEVWSCSPRWVWLMVIPVIINGSSPFLGFKTETSFAMYSNLRTEGNVSNHAFMPTLNVVKMQEDLVNILDSNHPQLTMWIEQVPLRDRDLILRKMNVVYFELNRVVAETIAQHPEQEFYVTYTRNNGPIQTFRSTDPNARDAEVAQLRSIILRKLMFFRPVFAGEKSYCQH